MADALRARVAEITWHHSIDLGHGIVTPGLAAAGPVDDRAFPSFTGRSVLDVGAWDGYYSFLAERRGASRVVAMDHYVWGVDLPARTAYWDECRAKGTLPDHRLDESVFWRGDELPGRRGFDLARQALDSRVEPVVADLMATDLDEMGTFDVVLYLGVLYHMKEPLTALERLRRVTGEVAVIETAAVWIAGLEDEPLTAFFAGDELAHDYGNWYAPNQAALHAWCRAAGFRRVETVVGPPGLMAARRVKHAVTGADGNHRVVHYRTVVHACP